MNSSLRRRSAIASAFRSCSYQPAMHQILLNVTYDNIWFMSRPLESRHLETFFVVADELHFGRAATRLHVAQPAVSHTIAALEEEVGTPLFDRSQRRVQLTAAGRTFLTEAHEAAAQLQRAISRARSAATGTVGQLRLAFTAVCALSPLPQQIAAFMKTYPNVEVRLEQLGTREQFDALKLGRIDLGFSVFPESDEHICSRPFVKESLAAFVPSTHQLANRRKVKLSALLQEPFILMSRRKEPKILDAYLGLCTKYSVTPNIVLELDQLESMFGFVAAGLGVSLAPWVARRLRLDGVVALPVTPALPGGIAFSWHKGHLASSTMLFIEYLGFSTKGE